MGPARASHPETSEGHSEVLTPAHPARAEEYRGFSFEPVAMTTAPASPPPLVTPEQVEKVGSKESMRCGAVLIGHEWSQVQIFARDQLDGLIGMLQCTQWMPPNQTLKRCDCRTFLKDRRLPDPAQSRQPCIMPQCPVYKRVLALSLHYGALAYGYSVSRPPSQPPALPRLIFTLVFLAHTVLLDDLDKRALHR